MFRRLAKSGRLRAFCNAFLVGLTVASFMVSTPVTSAVEPPKRVLLVSLDKTNIPDLSSQHPAILTPLDNALPACARRPNGQFQANTFQGHFPAKNTGEDGFIGTAPVGTFRPNGFGLFDMAGNVWEWTSDWYRPDYYTTLAATKQVARNPKGPADSLDPSEPGVAKRVQKGGSFLCTDEYCSRYMPGGRGKGEPDTGTNHLGFRCVRSPR